MVAQLESPPLQPVLRLIHCIQKERGASCALVGSLAQPNASVGSSEEYPYESNLRSARIASNSAISSFYGSTIWNIFCGGNKEGDLEIATLLFRVRELVDGGGRDGNEHRNEYLFFHDVIVEYNSFLSKIIQQFVVVEVSKRKIDLQRKINDPKLLNEARRNAKVALSLLDLILSFVRLKESLGMERATLSGLMANGGINEMNDESADVIEELIEAKHPNNGARLNLIVNDLVVVVENQHRMMQDLRKQTGLDIHASFESSFTGAPDANELLFDGNYCTLLKLVGESIMPSSAFLSLQDHVRKDFDIDRFQNAMAMEQFWSEMTLYMDSLHSMELFLLEELENCEGSSVDLDLLSLEREQPSRSILHGALEGFDLSAVSTMTKEELKDALVSFLTPKETKPQSLASPAAGSSGKRLVKSRSASICSKDSERHALEEWEISLYDVEFHKRIGRGSAGTTYLGKYCQQKVAVKVAASSDMGLDGWTAELKSLKKLHHTNIIRFLGAIYNPSPLTYCLVLEYCDGGDLSVALADNTPPKFFNDVASGVATGVYYLHKMKFLHRDIKPSNVLLSGDPKSGNFVAKLTDFGLAVKVQNASVNDGKKELTAETGTYRYMAPEVIRHEPYNYAADVYSFGLLMWEIITREKPFEPKSQIEAAGSVALEGKRPPFPNDTPLAVRTLIEKCWVEKPNERMEVKHIIECLEELGSDIAAESWLAAPTGHPVYKKKVQDETRQAVQDEPQKKKVSVLTRKTSWLFREKKK
ncbi:hypothetical protein ACHAXR_010157 [Thalassiosira sp. AJA248-18]